jgi:hypothetical protein
MTESEVCAMQAKGNYIRRRNFTTQRNGASNRVLPDNTIIRNPDRVFQSESLPTPI